MAAFSEGANFSTSANGKTLDPRLLDILKTAAQQYGLDVQATSGVQGRSTGTKNHPGGYAVDIKLVDPSTGKALPNYHQDIKGSFPVYEKFAQTARVVQQAKYPELNNQFRWGGYFAGGVNPADLMHFDINPKMNGAMGGGSWDGGASSSFKKTWGITTANPGLGTVEGQRQVASIKQGLAGGPLPPMNIPQVGTALDVIDRVVPRPMPSQIASAYASTQTPPRLPASSAVPRLQADNTLSYGQKSGITPEAKYAAAQSSHNDFGLGALADPRTAALLAPANAPAVPTYQPGMTGRGLPPPVPTVQPGMMGRGIPSIPAAPPLPRGGIPGMVSPGNINLNNRPVYFGNDGSYGTERSFSIGTDQGEVLIPQIVGGKLVSEQQAIDHYMKTGENLGIFKTPEAADAYASQLHQRDQGLGNMPVPMPGRPASLAPSTHPSIAPQQASTPRKTVTVQPLPSSYTINPNAVIDKAKQAGVISGPASWLPDQTIWDGAMGQQGMRDRIAAGLPQGSSLDPKTNTVHVADPQALANEYLGKVPSLFRPMAREAVIPAIHYAESAGYVKPQWPASQTFPLPVPRPATPIAPVRAPTVQDTLNEQAQMRRPAAPALPAAAAGVSPSWWSQAFPTPAPIYPPVNLNRPVGVLPSYVMPRSLPANFYAQPAQTRVATSVAAPRIVAPVPMPAPSPSNGGGYANGKQNAINDTLRTLGFNV